MRATEAVFAVSNGTNIGPFTLRGGLYGFDVLMTGIGTVTLERLAGDGTTYVTAATALSAAGYATAYLTPGTYKFAIDTVTAVYAVIARVPFE